MNYRISLFSLLFILSIGVCANSQTNINSPAPIVNILRDDHVATIEMDFDADVGWGGQLWNVGTDGKDACGYRVQWWPDASEAGNIIVGVGCYGDNNSGTMNIATAASPHQLVTPNPSVQIQPIANNILYHVKVEKLNGLGQICSPATEMTFQGGDPIRVDDLRNTLTFFDDFNLPMGPANELNWNNAMGPQTDERFNLFFINAQCHAHSLNGTRNDGAGDKSQTAQRARKPILIENSVRRKIVFDMDGIYSGRSVWYLDFNPVKTDLTGHLSFFDFDGDAGLPADVLRLKANGNEISVNLINGAGESYHLASAYLPDFGKRMMPNVRRAFDVRLGTDGIQIFVDGTSVMDEAFTPGAFKAGVYDLLWSVVGYNTSKDDVPYFLSHWDNFGFDGPNVEPFIVHNYVTRIAGTDLQKSSMYNNEFPIYNIKVPDDIRPLVPGITNEVYLVFSYLKNDYSSFSIGALDSFTFNGNSFPLPQGANNTNPLVPERVDYAGSSISNRVKIGEVQQGGISPLNIGDNTIQFFAENTGIINVHVEVMCPSAAPPPLYTQPAQIHHFVHHGELPKLGLSAKMVFIDGHEFDFDANEELNAGSVSGTIPIEVLVGNGNWANWAPQWLNQPATSAEMWSTGGTTGIQKVELFIKAKGSASPGFIVASLNTNGDAPSPQLRYQFNFNTAVYPNGEYELYLLATSSAGVKSHPAYHGFGFKFDASELAGAYYPIIISIENPTSIPQVFSGANGPIWTNGGSWQSGNMPPNNFNGTIVIDADCEVPSGYHLQLGPGTILVINGQKQLRIK